MTLSEQKNGMYQYPVSKKVPGIPSLSDQVF